MDQNHLKTGPFVNRTICEPDMFGPFENRTSPVFECLLYYTSYATYIPIHFSPLNIYW